MGKVIGRVALENARRRWRRGKKKVVFTNGTFDILHRGHVEYLAKARSLGDILVVGLNTDASIRRIKGPRRPINSNKDRATVLAALAAVDYICFFGEETPERLIRQVVPDVLVKGADWKIAAIVGKEIVEQHGGSVKTIRLTPGRSTSNIIRRVLDAYTARR
ncbi:MAG: D-glycero-beta-D-manno-heptose 1-phosphate adenylyltransferase [Bacteroidota bacterium]